MHPFLKLFQRLVTRLGLGKLLLQLTLLLTGILQCLFCMSQAFFRHRLLFLQLGNRHDGCFPLLGQYLHLFGIRRGQGIDVTR